MSESRLNSFRRVLGENFKRNGRDDDPVLNDDLERICVFDTTMRDLERRATVGCHFCRLLVRLKDDWTSMIDPLLVAYLGGGRSLHFGVLPKAWISNFSQLYWKKPFSLSINSPLRFEGIAAYGTLCLIGVVRGYAS
jgi:hypothetical protein